MDEITVIMLSPQRCASLRSKYNPKMATTEIHNGNFIRCNRSLLGFYSNTVEKPDLRAKSMQQFVSNSRWIQCLRKQVYRPRVTQIRLTESITHQRAERLSAASHLLLPPCETFMHTGRGRISMYVGLFLKHRCGFVLKCSARHRCARLVRSCRPYYPS